MRALDEVRLFDHLARTRHYGRASAEAHVSPSTLSRTITRLEAEVGVRLFDRDRRSVSLTPDGVRFQAFARDVLDAWERFQSGGGAKVAGTLSLFCTVTASQTLLPDVLVRFRKAYPAVHLQVETGYAAEALERLEEGAVDLTVAALPARVPRHLLTRVIATTPLVLVAPARSPYKVSRTPSAAWSRVPFVLPAGGLARALVDRWFRRIRVQPVVAAEAAGHEAVLSLVSLGSGVGIVPRLVADQSPLAARLRVLPVSVEMPSFDIAVCTVADRMRNPAVAAFWETLGALPA
jgi:LysR family positive regulator for ilvC